MKPFAKKSYLGAACLLLGTSVVVVGCGDALVGGACASGFEERDGTCLLSSGLDSGFDASDGSNDGTLDGNGEGGTDGEGGADGESGGDGESTGDGGDGSPGDGATGDGSNGDGSSGDGSSEASVCTPPLLRCNGICIDVQSDPDNCGACDHVCASNICVAAKCQGETTGDIVYVGHDFVATPPGSAQAKLLLNAILLTTSTPVRVLSYQRYADPLAVARLNVILANAQAQTGRMIVVTSTIIDSDVPTKLAAKAVDVLLVPDQVSAPAGALLALGTSWKASLTPFAHAGGIFVTLDGASGTGEMPAFETGSGALTVTAHAAMAPPAIVQLAAPNDAIGTGVVSPFGTRKSSSHFATEANAGPVVWVVVDPASSEPNVVHKVAP